MKLAVYILSLAAAFLLAFESEWLCFWLFVAVAALLIWGGNRLENEFINHN
jgi:hypothetical protein